MPSIFVGGEPVVGDQVDFDLSHGIATGLVTAWVASRPLHSLMRRPVITAPGGFVRTAYQPAPVAMRVNAADSSSARVTANRAVSTAEVTMMWFGQVSALNQYSDLMSVGNGTNNLVLELQVPPQYEPAIYNIGYGSGGASAATSLYLNGGWAVVVVRGSNARNLSDVTVNGAQWGSGTWAATGTWDRMTVANRSASVGARTGGGLHVAAFAWNRYISDAEIDALTDSFMSARPLLLSSKHRAMVPFSAGGGATASGATFTANSSLIAGAATGQRNATAAGQTLTATSSLIAGAATGQINATAAGQTLVAASSLVAGAATGQVNAAAAGQTLTATSSLVAGSAAGQINASAAGVTLTATSSLVPGSASGAKAGSAAGATLTATASLVLGAATGVRNATAAGVTLTATSSLQAGSASGQTGAIAAGVVLSAGTTIVAGTASAANDAIAAGVVIQAAASFIAGAATGPSGATAAGVVINLQAVMLRGSAYGPNLSATPGFTAVGRPRRFTATRDRPIFEAAIGADGRNLPRRRTS